MFININVLVISTEKKCTVILGTIQFIGRKGGQWFLGGIQQCFQLKVGAMPKIKGEGGVMQIYYVLV